MRVDQIAIETITVHADAKRDMLRTLRRLAELGYRNVEFAGTGSATPEETRHELDLLGLRAVAVQVGFPGADSLQQLVDYALLLGAGYAVITWVPAELRPNAAAAGRLAELFNRLGELCRDAGIGCAYHNHDFEFAAQSDGRFFD